ncbi:MAG: phosphoribosyltransferase, partial [Gammaproteobacteria bacterium]
MNKQYIDANELLQESFQLASSIYSSGYRPDLIVGVWRGGAPIAIAVHEYFSYMGWDADHIAIRSLSYTGINERVKEVKITGLEYIA